MSEKQELLQRENKAESREVREDAQLDKELKAAAAMERADFLSREVKNNQQQVQNIVLHMQQVITIIKQLRAQLSLPDSGDATSLEEDGRRVEKLKKLISEHRNELESMREELMQEQIQLIMKDNPQIVQSDATVQAKIKVAQLYSDLED